MDQSCEQLQRKFTFEDLNLHPWLYQQCSSLGLKCPSPVQLYCIPEILRGRDCFAISQTGTGKTLAFALPILQKLSEDPYGIFALILTPTRELAYQIAEQFRVFGKPIGLQVSMIVGGCDMMYQAMELSTQPHIVIATPGRLSDHLESCKEFSLKNLQFLVLDEGDRLLDGHFSEQLDTIFEVVPQKRQTLLFSATMTDSLEELKNVSTSNPFFWSYECSIATVEKLTQQYILTAPGTKDAYLVHIIQKFQDKYPHSSIIVFTKTVKHCQVLSMSLNNLGFKNLSLNSMLSQKERVASLTKFKSKNVKLLIATDIASRGLDIPAVDLVINHNVPSKAKDYIHRVGRTARAGRGGLAVTLITLSDIKRLYAIEDLINTKLTEYKSSEKKVMSILVQVNVAIREAEIILSEKDFDKKKIIYKRKKEMLLDDQQQPKKMKSEHSKTYD